MLSRSNGTWSEMDQGKAYSLGADGLTRCTSYITFLTLLCLGSQGESMITVLDHGFVRYVDHMGTDERIVEAARISYKSPSKGVEADTKLINYLFKNKHTSPFEMCKITFNVK